MTFSVVKETPSTVYGQNEPQISKRLGVFEDRKFCRRIGNAFWSNDSTNDREMVSIAGKLLITRSGYYAVNFALDLTTMGQIYNVVLNVNWSQVRQTFEQIAAGAVRSVINGNWLGYLNAWDLLSMTNPDGGSIQNTTGTYLEAIEL